jgi:hypothetical protein
MHILSDVIKRWVSRFLATEPKTRPLSDKAAAEDRLLAHGFRKGVDGLWQRKDWWKPKDKN